MCQLFLLHSVYLPGDYFIEEHSLFQKLLVNDFEKMFLHKFKLLCKTTFELFLKMYALFNDIIIFNSYHCKAEYSL